MATAPVGLTPPQFVAKWARTALPERAASHEHFIDVCRLLGQPTPAEHDATGAEYTFEKGAAVTGPASAGSMGKRGFADVWWRGKFAWEYKGKGKYLTLDEAYRQLCQYREALENPPLLIVSDITRTEIHTNFTGTAKVKHEILLERLAEPEQFDLLRRVFAAPESFKPTVTPEAITRDIAERFGGLAQSLRERGHDPHDAAHFLMKCMFCLFAEDVGLLPENLFARTISQWREDPPRLCEVLTGLFSAMRTGGTFGPDPIAWFDGGLFDETPAMELTEPEAGVLILAAKQDWANVEPAIFGTLFERSLDPDKRSQIGAHYTSREDIMLVVEPIVMAPLREEWREVQGRVEAQLDRRRKAKTPATRRKADKAITDALQRFQHHLAELRVLDPACGSGNFLYVAIQQLLELEKEVITVASRPELGLGGLLPRVRPTQLHGLEINLYAAELAQVVIWIGYLQWMRDNGFNTPRDPILEPIDTIEERDAILAWQDESGEWIRGWNDTATCRGVADWPDADFIIGNPPFLGSKLFRKWGLPESYIEAMYARYELPNTSDLCCYWFERARQEIESAVRDGRSGRPRVGLLATQGIRGGDNRTTLDRVKSTGDIFAAWSDRPWILDGANVHVSIVGFDDGTETARVLDNRSVGEIHATLTAGVDVSGAAPLDENADIAFMGDTKGGAFDIRWTEAMELLRSPNASGLSNLEVLRPWINGRDVTQRRRGMWIVDFGPGVELAAAARYEEPFHLVERRVRDARRETRQVKESKTWWLHVRPRPEMRARLPEWRCIVTPRLTKYRFFHFLDRETLPDAQLIAFARSDDYMFGVLQSSIHELWARARGTQLREAESGFRYTPTTCFETFPLPWPPGSEPGDATELRRIERVAGELSQQRGRWLDPPEWLDAIERAVDAENDWRGVEAVSGKEAVVLLRESAIMAAAAEDPELKRRTLTNLYNDRPTWLKVIHECLDQAVLGAYAVMDPGGGWDEEWAEVWRDSGAGQPLPDDHELVERRAEIDEVVLANLLRLNEERGH